MWGEDWTIDQPRKASPVTVVSSSTSDTSQVITIFGTVNGYPDSQQITLNGTTPATATTNQKSFSSIERVSKSASTIGRVTVTTNSTQETIAVLPTGDTTAGIKYKKVQIYPAPDAIYKMNVIYYKEPYRLVNDNDIHELGPDFDELIILMATSKLDGEQSKKGVETFAALFGNELKILRRKNADKLDYLPRLGRPSQSFWNQRYGRGPHPWLAYQQFGSKFGPSGYYSGRRGF
jgi:hypothetical protein